MKGKVQLERVGSPLLKGNPLGDPHMREVPVYLPPSYGQQPFRRYPVIFYLTGFAGCGRSAVNHDPWKENIAERLDRLIGEKKAKECILVFPDCFTAYGGSQYLDSSATGPYASHVVKELVPFIEDKFVVVRGPQGRAVMGKSSGGFGALSLAMRHPGVFGHCASHSGDMMFEHCYGPDMPKFAAALSKYGSAKKLQTEFLASKRKYAFDHALVNMMGMASCYSPAPKSALGFDLPMDERTGELRPWVWKRWLENDPVRLAGRKVAALRALETLWFDAGRRDEYFLQLGARKLSDELKRLRVAHVYEEHEFGHRDMAERYDVSLALLSRRLSA